MTHHDIALIVFGAGLGSVATMFATAYYMVRQFEREDAKRQALRRRYG